MLLYEQNLGCACANVVEKIVALLCTLPTTLARWCSLFHACLWRV